MMSFSRSKTAPGLFKWGGYTVIVIFGLAAYMLGKAMSLSDPLLVEEFRDEFFSMSLLNRTSFFRQAGGHSYGGYMIVFGVLAYGLHLLAGIYWKRNKFFVWGWLVVLLLMTVVNLLSFYGLSPG